MEYYNGFKMKLFSCNLHLYTYSKLYQLTFET